MKITLKLGLIKFVICESTVMTIEPILGKYVPLIIVKTFNFIAREQQINLPNLKPGNNQLQKI